MVVVFVWVCVMHTCLYMPVYNVQSFVCACVNHVNLPLAKPHPHVVDSGLLRMYVCIQRTLFMFPQPLLNIFRAVVFLQTNWKKTQHISYFWAVEKTTCTLTETRSRSRSRSRSRIIYCHVRLVSPAEILELQKSPALPPQYLDSYVGLFRTTPLHEDLFRTTSLHKELPDVTDRKYENKQFGHKLFKLTKTGCYHSTNWACQAGPQLTYTHTHTNISHISHTRTHKYIPYITPWHTHTQIYPIYHTHTQIYPIYHTHAHTNISHGYIHTKTWACQAGPQLTVRLTIFFSYIIMIMGLPCRTHFWDKAVFIARKAFLGG